MNVGDVFATNYWGDAEVVELLGGRNVVIRFVNTGHVRKARSDYLLTGSVKDTEADAAGSKPTKKVVKCCSVIGTGDLFQSNGYGIMEVVEYRGSKDIQIRFVDTGNELSIQKNALITGQVQDVLLRAQRTAKKVENDTVTKVARDLALQVSGRENYHLTRAGKAEAIRKKIKDLVEQRVLMRECKVVSMIGSVYQNKLGDNFTIVAETSGAKTWVVEFDGTCNRYEVMEGYILSGGVHDHDSGGYAERQRVHAAAAHVISYEANREKRIAQAGAYQRNNVERTRESNRRNRRKRTVAEGSHTAVEKLNLLKRQDNKCNCCGYNLANGKHIDHIMPISLGGSDSVENMQWLCQVCNSVKAGRHPDDWAIYSVSDEYRERLSLRRKLD